MILILEFYNTRGFPIKDCSWQDQHNIIWCVCKFLTRQKVQWQEGEWWASQRQQCYQPPLHELHRCLTWCLHYMSVCPQAFLVPRSTIYSPNAREHVRMNAKCKYIYMPTFNFFIRSRKEISHVQPRSASLQCNYPSLGVPRLKRTNIVVGRSESKMHVCPRNSLSWAEREVSTTHSEHFYRNG